MGWGADKTIKVRALAWEEAWNLFVERCGDVVPSSEIRPVAEKVVEECSGLPLAIKTVGRAMHLKDKKELWENALRALKGSSPEVAGTSVASKFLRANGISLFKVREGTVKLLGKSDMYYFSPEHPPLTEPGGTQLGS